MLRAPGWVGSEECACSSQLWSLCASHKPQTGNDTSEVPEGVLLLMKALSWPKLTLNS